MGLTRRRILQAAATAPLLAAMPACTRRPSAGESERSSGGSGGVIRAGSSTIPPSIKLTPQTVIVPSGRNAITGFSQDRKSLRMAANAAIKPGSVVVLSDFGVFRAEAVEKSGNDLLVKPGKCAISDLIHDGRIEVNNLRISPRDGHGPTKARASGLFDFLIPPAYAQDTSAMSGKLGEFDYQIQYAATDDAVNVDAGLTGDIAGFKSELKANGNLAGFDISYHTEVRSGNPENLGLLLKSLVGEVNLEATAERHDNASHPGQQMLKIPYEFSWPIVISGIPFLLKLGVALLLNEGLTNINAAAKFGVKLNFKGSSGFDMPLPGEPKQADPKIDTSLDTDFSFKHAESVGLGPQALLVAMQCPRLAFGLGLDLPFVDCFAGPYIDVVTTASHVAAGAMSLVPCQRNQLIINGAVGCDVEFLKWSSGEKFRKEAYRKEITRAVPDSKACRGE